MQKIELTMQTLGIIVDRLRKVTSGLYSFTEARDVNPRRCREWDKKMPAEITASAEINVHNFLLNPTGIRLCSFQEGKPGFPMIHMAFDAELAVVFDLGDVFYFKGDKIIINQTTGIKIGDSGDRNCVIKIQCLKKGNDLTQDEIDVIHYHKHSAEQSVQAWNEIVKDDLERELDDFVY